jgi:hypothetical protein
MLRVKTNRLDANCNITIRIKNVHNASDGKINRDEPWKNREEPRKSNVNDNVNDNDNVNVNVNIYRFRGGCRRLCLEKFISVYHFFSKKSMLATFEIPCIIGL